MVLSIGTVNYEPTSHLIKYILTLPLAKLIKKTEKRHSFWSKLNVTTIGIISITGPAEMSLEYFHFDWPLLYKITASTEQVEPNIRLSGVSGRSFLYVYHHGQNSHVGNIVIYHTCSTWPFQKAGGK